jgi:hypothetical protein
VLAAPVDLVLMGRLLEQTEAVVHLTELLLLEEDTAGTEHRKQPMQVGLLVALGVEAVLYRL